LIVRRRRGRPQLKRRSLGGTAEVKYPETGGLARSHAERLVFQPVPFAPPCVTAAALVLALLRGVASSAPTQQAATHVSATIKALGPRADSSLTVRITVVVDPGWHIGAQRAGTAGLPTTLSWKLPDGWTVSDVQWPIPVSRMSATGTLYVYQGRFHIDASLVPSMPKLRRPIRAVIVFGACREDLCVPGQLTLDLRP
jgi:thiol:disulfide interchange protein DsbD